MTSRKLFYSFTQIAKKLYNQFIRSHQNTIFGKEKFQFHFEVVFQQNT
jgi:hypothetical protein